MLPSAAVDAIRENITVYGVANDGVIIGREQLLRRNSLKPVMLMTSDLSRYAILDRIPLNKKNAGAYALAFPDYKRFLLSNQNFIFSSI